MNILVVDDHRLFVNGLRLVLQQLSDETEIVEAYTAQRALGLIDSGTNFDLILTDLKMPGFGGHELVQSFTSRKLTTPVAVISASESLTDMKKAYELGAAGYIFKSDSSFDLISKIQNLMKGEEMFPETFWQSLSKNETQVESAASKGISGLGKRKMEVLHLLAQGKSNKQIAAILCISETTAKFHIRSLFAVLGVNNRTWCVREAIRLELIDDIKL